MSSHTHRFRGLVALTALLAIGATDARAQDSAPERGRGFGPAANAEMIMSMRDRLELTEDQLAALEEIRVEQVAIRNSHRAAMDEMRSRLRAGEIDRDEMRTFMEQLRSGAPEVAESRRERIEGILNESQLQQLEEMRSRRGQMRRGRSGMRRGGPGFGPGRSGVGARRPGMQGGRAGVRGGPAAWRAQRIGPRGRAAVIRGERMRMRGERLWIRGERLERLGRRAVR